MNDIERSLAYFRRAKAHTDLGPHYADLSGLPADLPGLCEVVRGWVLHPFDAPLFGVQLPPEREAQDGFCRGAAAKLGRILALDGRPLTQPRPPAARLSAHCMNFAVLLTALLHRRGVPARVRSGFAAYFDPAKRYNHWITEVWRADEDRWVRVDAQMGPQQREALGLRFDVHDLPAGQFETATEAWAACRAGQSDPGVYGWDWERPEAHGWPYLRAQVVHDIAALHGTDSFPGTDRWGLAVGEDVTGEELSLLDHAADLANLGHAGFERLRALYEAAPGLRAPTF